MSPENPNLISRVPTQEELTANHFNENAINFSDRAQLAEFNAAMVAGGRAPREAPGEYVSPVLPPSPSVSPELEPFFEQEGEQTITRVELNKLRNAPNIGHTLLRGDVQ
jgi:hypothetical protein